MDQSQHSEDSRPERPNPTDQPGGQGDLMPQVNLNAGQFESGPTGPATALSNGTHKLKGAGYIWTMRIVAALLGLNLILLMLAMRDGSEGAGWVVIAAGLAVFQFALVLIVLRLVHYFWYEREKSPELVSGEQPAHVGQTVLQPDAMAPRIMKGGWILALVTVVGAILATIASASTITGNSLIPWATPVYAFLVIPVAGTVGIVGLWLCWRHLRKTPHLLVLGLVLYSSWAWSALIPLASILNASSRSNNSELNKMLGQFDFQVLVPAAAAQYVVYKDHLPRLSALYDTKVFILEVIRADKLQTSTSTIEDTFSIYERSANGLGEVTPTTKKCFAKLNTVSDPAPCAYDFTTPAGVVVLKYDTEAFSTTSSTKSYSYCFQKLSTYICFGEDISRNQKYRHFGEHDARLEAFIDSFRPVTHDELAKMYRK